MECTAIDDASSTENEQENYYMEKGALFESDQKLRKLSLQRPQLSRNRHETHTFDVSVTPNQSSHTFMESHTFCCHVVNYFYEEGIQ